MRERQPKRDRRISPNEIATKEKRGQDDERGRETDTHTKKSRDKDRHRKIVRL